MSSNLSISSVRQILYQDLNLHHYKVQVVQELKLRYFLTHKNVCQKMLTEMGHDNVIHIYLVQLTFP
jgi:hypothetical protein